ncbi:radical SAM family heme chaperone HemW [bacterium]|nr:radical SAM family heme chaperone HemW [bacterium]
MNVSLYIHIPFCRHRCHYCDFITTTGQDDKIGTYIEAINKELRIAITTQGKFSIHSIYFGGGTPSIVPANHYKEVIGLIRSKAEVTDDCEISMEANPGSISPDYLGEVRAAGINRLSLGVQSTDPFDLQRLDRIHDIDDVVRGVQDARRAGFDNINLDMIFALPWQDLDGWQRSLFRALALQPDHFSLYSLIVEPGTLLNTWYQRGLIAVQDQDLEAEMYEHAMSVLKTAGFEHYETSNWARKDKSRDFKCRHNLQYWHNQPYIGIGAGAHGYINNIRTENVHSLVRYLKLMEAKDQPTLPFPTTPATQHTESIDRLTQMKDQVMLGLRLVSEGVDGSAFASRFGEDMEVVFASEIEKLSRNGLVEWVGDKKALRLTRRGVMLANQAFMEFV